MLSKARTGPAHVGCINQREIIVVPLSSGRSRRWHIISSLAATFAGLLTILLLYIFQDPLFADLDNYPLTLFVFF
jgi:hypothetical protein